MSTSKENLQLLKEKEMNKRKKKRKKPNDVNYDKAKREKQKKRHGIVKKGRRKILNKIKSKYVTVAIAIFNIFILAC